MTDETALSFEIDALFEHLTTDLDHQLDDIQQWVFELSSNDVQILESIADQLKDDYDLAIQEVVEHIDLDGNSSPGMPTLSIMRTAALTPEEVKEIAAQLKRIAAANGIIYGGVNCYDPVDEEELFGWLPFEDAVWRLRHFTSSGLGEDAEIPWAFLITTPTLEGLDSTETVLRENGFDHLQRFEEPDEEDGSYALCLFLEGRNNESELAKAYERIEVVADGSGAKLSGVQFFEED